MFHNRPCGCKGQRTCLTCEHSYEDVANKAKSWVADEEKKKSYVYCPECDLAWPGWEADSWKVHPNHGGESIKFPGVKVIQNFVSKEEEAELMRHLDEVPWDLSQSGRRKQNYGPKCNFKKRRAKVDNFSGYPAFTKFIQDRFNSVDVLKNFQTVEQCSLDYPVETGASIDPHIDDCWIWGERIPTLSLLVDSVLTLRKYIGPETKYNLMDTYKYPAIMRENEIKKEEEIIQEFQQIFQDKATVESEKTAEGASFPPESDPGPNIVRLPMPQRSLIIFYGPPRYKWEHGILREDIPSRRVCITYRELTPPYLPFGSESKTGTEILEASKNFWDHYQHYGITCSS
ncbi:alpha-ketoglutarate-dependent dioxygenase alkB homolog 4-like [Penaeus japonicus]|uniref:alpha-ketoglutarate-dependent dioxygenase alkB homolog 4-like n=1 Tax=Penaeus japonicus TaxID=27405 RepID=UPI001C70E3F6|nr:alpha-ketoglutarate-dependent dioxygenase alkB homolog 4-like [Penaeus japonicus]